MYAHCELDKKAAEPSYKEAIGCGQESESKTSSTDKPVGHELVPSHFKQRFNTVAHLWNHTED